MIGLSGGAAMSEIALAVLVVDALMLTALAVALVIRLATKAFTWWSELLDGAAVETR